MDTVGDGTGSIDGNIDGSVTPQILRIKASVDILYVERIIIFWQDTQPAATKYGGIAQLANGVQLLYKRFVGDPEETTLIDLTAGSPIIDNSHWKALCHDEIFQSYGTGDDAATYRYTFSKDTGGSPLVLTAANKEELQIVINDDLTGLTEHHFRIGCHD
jgi:hypothetical protein